MDFLEAWCLVLHHHFGLVTLTPAAVGLGFRIKVRVPVRVSVTVKEKGDVRVRKLVSGKDRGQPAVLAQLTEPQESGVAGMKDAVWDLVAGEPHGQPHVRVG